MKLVCSALGHDAYNAARIAPVLGTIVVFENAKLRNRIRVGISDYAVIEQVVVQTTVKKIRDRIRSHTADTVTPRSSGIGVCGANAGLRLQQIERIAAIQRQLKDGLSGHSSAN